jgi:hypothetical protein
VRIRIGAGSPLEKPVGTTYDCDEMDMLRYLDITGAVTSMTRLEPCTRANEKIAGGGSHDRL